jgi:hypothetical protein
MLMVVAVAVMGAHQIWRSQQPSDEEVQRRMQEGLDTQKQLREVQETFDQFRADQDRAFGTQPHQAHQGDVPE